MSGLSLNLTSFVDADSARSHLLAKVDRLAEDLRSQFITSYSGQAMTYEAKYQEALRYPQGTRFPFLQAEATALGKTLSEVADSILLARTQWEELGSQIEAARLKTKAAIQVAATPEEMMLIESEAFTELPSI